MSSNWITLPPRPEIAAKTGDMAAVERDITIRELMRNTPEVFITGMFAGMDTSEYHWKDMFTPTEVEIIEKCADYARFDIFLNFMLIAFPEENPNKVQHRAMKLWDQIMVNRGE